MPLQNRLTPTGEFVAEPVRGLFMGNRGGRLHLPMSRTLGNRRWVSKAWITCVLDFKGRHRNVWRDGYTELFFLDEVTALAAGHRPCFECRRQDAIAFALAASDTEARLHADDLDQRLHAERLAGRTQRVHPEPIASLPDGAMITLDDQVFAVRGERLVEWTIRGYGRSIERPQWIGVTVLTPPTTLAALTAGYRPAWHPSIDRS